MYHNAFYKGLPSHFGQDQKPRRVGNRAWRWHDLLQLVINRFEHPYSALCFLESQYSVEIMLFPMGNNSWQYFNGKRNTV